MSYDPCPNHGEHMLGACPICDDFSRRRAPRQALQIGEFTVDLSQPPPRARGGVQILTSGDYEERGGGLRLPIPMSRKLPARFPGEADDELCSSCHSPLIGSEKGQCGGCAEDRKRQDPSADITTEGMR